MATIFYGMSGEGRGHATRARAVVEALRGRHRLTLFAADCAHSLLAPVYRGTDVRVVQIPGMRFSYGAAGAVSLLSSVAGGLRYRMALEGYARAVLPELERERPDLVIADFEPILPRAARQLGIPFVSFDHQHYLVVSDLSALPFWLRQQAALAAPVVRALYRGQAATIVSSFYRPPLKRAYRDAQQAGVLIRPELRSARPECRGHLVAYFRRFAAPALLDSLESCGRPVHLYGLGARPARGALRFLAIDERRFLEDLVTCDAVVSTAGNQLVGEALYLRKPVLALPEASNFEQSLNAYFLEQSGAGWAERRALTVHRLRAFLDASEALRARIDPRKYYGNDEAVAALGRHLPSAAPETLTTPAPSQARAQWA